jgi:hypothetical protein
MIKMIRRWILALSIDSAVRSIVFIFAGKTARNFLLIQVKIGEDSLLAIVKGELNQRRNRAD